MEYKLKPEDGKALEEILVRIAREIDGQVHPLVIAVEVRLVAETLTGSAIIGVHVQTQGATAPAAAPAPDPAGGIPGTPASQVDALVADLNAKLRKPPEKQGGA